MLEALEACGADMMYDCRRGECGLCQVQVLDVQGVIDHRDVFLSDDQHAAERPAAVLRVPRRQPRTGGHRPPTATRAADYGTVTIDVP